MLEAFEKSKTAASTADYTAMVELLERALEKELPPDRLQYAKRLLGWALNRRGEAHLAAAGQARTEKQEDEIGQLEAQAAADFAAALVADPNHWKALHNRGVNSAQAGKFDEALADFNRALELQQRYANTWFNRGEIHFARGEFVKAIADYTQAANLDPQDALARLARGNAYLSLAQWDRAAADYRQATALDPSLGRAQQSAAWLLATCPDGRFRDAAQALTAARRAIELEGETHQTLDVLAAAFASGGRYDEAQAAIAKALSAAPEAARAALQERQSLYAARRPFRQGSAPGVP